MLDYHVIYQGCTPCKIVSNPLTFQDANDLACLLQADVQADVQEESDSIAGILSRSDFFIVQPIFRTN